MPGSVTADKIIGKGLIAKKNIDRLNSSLQKIGVFKPGESVGVVYSYIQRGGKLYWLFQPDFMPPYLVEHTSTSFQITDDIANVIREQKLQREKEIRDAEIAIKGAIPYYIEKYGKFLVLIIAGAYIAKTYITKK
jgi:hypothetical protein